MATRCHPVQAITIADSKLYLAISDTLYCVSTTTKETLARWKAPVAALQGKASDVKPEEVGNGASGGVMEEDAEQASPVEKDQDDTQEPTIASDSVDVQMEDPGAESATSVGKRKRSPSAVATENVQEGAPEASETKKRKKNQKSKKRNTQLSASTKQPPPNFIGQLLIVPNRNLVVLTTLEDKTLRVLQADTLENVTEWTLHKRSSAICLYDDSTILVGDKFGDVYAYNIPSLPSESRAEQQAIFSDGSLLLGHVSLLTDLTVASPRTNSSKKFIITTDRDEHIRVTHGEKNLTHLIYNFCLGHTLFISRLLVTKNGVLVTGGGDDWLGTWRWDQGKLVSRSELRAHMESIFEGESRSELLKKMETRKRRRDDDKETIRIAVNGIWEVELTNRERFTDLLVSIEGIPLLFHYAEDPSFGTIVYKGAYRTPGPVLALAAEGSKCYITFDEESDSSEGLVKIFDANDLAPSEDSTIPALSDFFQDDTKLDSVKVEEEQLKGMVERLYTVETLRKGFGGHGDDE